VLLLLWMAIRFLRRLRQSGKAPVSAPPQGRGP
jgi:hypothetical protein